MLERQCWILNKADKKGHFCPYGSAAKGGTHRESCYSPNYISPSCISTSGVLNKWININLK